MERNWRTEWSNDERLLEEEREEEENDKEELKI